jgi:hypothetical protein
MNKIYRDLNFIIYSVIAIPIKLDLLYSFFENSITKKYMNSFLF